MGGHADIGQQIGVKAGQLCALAAGDHSQAQALGKIRKSAARLHAGNSHRGGVERGEPGLSFQVSSASVM